MNFLIKKVKYPDGSFYPIITEYNPKLHSPNKLTFRINSYNDLWFLKQIKDVLDYQKIKCHLTIPCLFDAQADRRFSEDQSHNLKLVCQFINEMKWESISIFHPHNQEVVEALINNVRIIDNHNFINDVLGWIQLSEPYDNKDVQKDLILLSPDAGSYKWIMKLANKLKWEGEVECASKSRKWEDNKSKLIQRIDRQDFDGKDCLIIDDLSIGGSTFIGLAKLLRERNIGKLFLAVSHITISCPNPELWEVFDKVFTTNSKGLNYVTQYDTVIDNLQVIELFNKENYG